MKASETKLQKILEGTQQYLVPLFQRPYSWEKQQWENLWNDLIDLTEQETITPHFMGSIVTLQTISVPEGVSKYLLIDGQQRLTTILILLAVVRDRAKQQKETNKLAEQINNTILINPYETGLELYKLQPTQADRWSFHHIIDHGSLNSETSLINECYRFFDKKISQKNIELSLIKTAIISGFSLVSILLDKDENPHLVFESLNAKGKPLSQADLIRNYFFMKINEEEQQKNYAKYWEPMQAALGDNLTEFIRHYLMKYGREVKNDQVYLTLKDRVNVKNALESLEDLAKFADYYNKLINPSQETNKSINSLLMRIKRLELTTVYPFLLNCYDDYSEGKFSIDEFVEVLKILENFIIRRFVCNLPTNSLNKMFPSLYSQIRQKIDQNFMVGLKETLSSKNYPKDEKFKSMLKEVELYGVKKSEKARLILESIEQSFGHKEGVSFNNLSIEHIMPQKLNKDWEKSLGEDWEITHELLLHTLGNLTLTGYNPELSNHRFPKKREILLESHLELNQYFQEKTTWNREDIEQRSEDLAEICLKIWPYFGEGSGQEKVEGIVRGTKPKFLFVNSKKYTVKTWRDVLETTLNIVADLDQDKFQKLVQDYPRFVNWNDQNLRDSRQLENGAFIEVNLSAEDINSFCLKVIERVGLSSEDWQVETFLR
ncbi:DUF262 domain-containing protein [Microcoleus sp. herbarium5]|uniref:DUF262 domain-containing protein n=1 Tax=Microcoleus sp. herbarium5 TaxID=3055434 RepID=UPI002FD51DBF